MAFFVVDLVHMPGAVAVDLRVHVRCAEVSAPPACWSCMRTIYAPLTASASDLCNYLVCPQQARSVLLNMCAVYARSHQGGASGETQVLATHRTITQQQKQINLSIDKTANANNKSTNETNSKTAKYSINHPTNHIAGSTRRPMPSRQLPRCVRIQS